MHHFELRNYFGQVIDLKTENCLIVTLPSVNQKKDFEHLIRLKENYNKISENIPNIFVLVHQKEDDIKSLLKKKNFPFPILSDSKARIIKTLGAYLKPLGIVQRSTFIFNHQGNISFNKTFMSNLEEHFLF